MKRTLISVSVYFACREIGNRWRMDQFNKERHGG
jgi:hypothetical protein